jgi:hypothetical protein
MATLHYIAAMRMVGIVELIARHGANIRAKLLIVSKKTVVFTAHLCSEKQYFVEIATFWQAISILYSRTKNAF